MANLRSDRPLGDINYDLDACGVVQFQVSSGRKPWATVTLSISDDGPHKLDLSVQVKGTVGLAVIYRSGYSDVASEQLWAAFGTAYARAVDAPRQPQPSFLAGEVGLNDFVQVSTAFGNIRGVVVDIVSSVRSGAVNLVVTNSDGELTTPLSEVRLVAKG
jgi:hypothetical protein